MLERVPKFLLNDHWPIQATNACRQREAGNWAVAYKRYCLEKKFPIFDVNSTWRYSKAPSWLHRFMIPRWPCIPEDLLFWRRKRNLKVSLSHQRISNLVIRWSQFVVLNRVFRISKGKKYCTWFRDIISTLPKGPTALEDSLLLYPRESTVNLRIYTIHRRKYIQKNSFQKWLRHFFDISDSLAVIHDSQLSLVDLSSGAILWTVQLPHRYGSSSHLCRLLAFSHDNFFNALPLCFSVNLCPRRQDISGVNVVSVLHAYKWKILFRKTFPFSYCRYFACSFFLPSFFSYAGQILFQR